MAKAKQGQQKKKAAAKKKKSTGSAPASTPAAGPVVSGQRQYADPKYVPLYPGQFSTGEVNQYVSYASTIQAIPLPRAGASMVMGLAGIIGDDAVAQIQSSGKLVFHAVGDTGADKSKRVQDETDVANMMAKDLSISTVMERPVFFFHLGDVVYEFGQAEDYYAQFYEPFCVYNAPILAIPGNHDGMVWNSTMESLAAFKGNFCAPDIEHADNASSLVRTTMNQPAVYFTLDAPFVSIIGLYSNVGDKGSGIISSMNGNYPQVGDAQKQFLISELKRLAPARNNNKTAVILAVHHPPYEGADVSTKDYCDDLDDAFKQGGLWPDVVLSGHAHDYERYARDINGRKIPYIVAGCGGYNYGRKGPSDPHLKVPANMTAKDPSLQAYVNSFGYLKVKVTAGKLAVIFNCTDPAYGPAFDSIVVDLATHQVTEGVKGRDPL